MPLNALFNHRQHELKSFFSQIKPRLLVASRHHEVFSGNDFLTELAALQLAPALTLMLNAFADDESLPDWYTTAQSDISHYAATPADEVAFSSFPAAVPVRRNSFRVRTMIMITACVPVPKSAL